MWNTLIATLYNENRDIVVCTWWVGTRSTTWKGENKHGKPDAHQGIQANKVPGDGGYHPSAMWNTVIASLNKQVFRQSRGEHHYSFSKQTSLQAIKRHDKWWASHWKSLHQALFVSVKAPSWHLLGCLGSGGICAWPLSRITGCHLASPRMKPKNGDDKRKKQNNREAVLPSWNNSKRGQLGAIKDNVFAKYSGSNPTCTSAPGNPQKREEAKAWLQKATPILMQHKESRKEEFYNGGVGKKIKSFELSNLL